jgi:hypothetical protein
MELQTDHFGDNEWSLSHWKDNVKTLLSGRKITKKKVISPLVQEKTEVHRPITGSFDLIESLKRIASE